MQSSPKFSENDIRPDHLMQAQAERFDNDVRRLLRYKDQFVQVPCPACGSADAEKTLEKFGLTYVTCTECRTMYANPRPSPPNRMESTTSGSSIPGSNSSRASHATSSAVPDDGRDLWIRIQ